MPDGVKSFPDIQQSEKSGVTFGRVVLAGTGDSDKLVAYVVAKAKTSLCGRLIA